MTNKEAYEKAAGMPLSYVFFLHNGIDPNAEYKEDERIEEDEKS